MKKLRLLLLTECNRTCKGCCNKDWNLEELPVCTDFQGYSEIILTGGEPLLQPDLVKEVVERIRTETDADIILYTAKTDDIHALRGVLSVIDGITVTLHTRKDVLPFANFNMALTPSEKQGKSLRLNVFNGINIGEEDTGGWRVKGGIRWMKDCPLPKDEVFKKLGSLP